MWIERALRQVACSPIGVKYSVTGFPYASVFIPVDTRQKYTSFVPSIHESVCRSVVLSTTIFFVAGSTSGLIGVISSSVTGLKPEPSPHRISPYPPPVSPVGRPPFSLKRYQITPPSPAAI